MSRLTLPLLLCTSLFSASSAWAQALPSSVDPSKLQESFGTLERKPKLEPKGAPIVPSIPAKPLSEAAKAVHFTVKSVVVEGATVYTHEQLLPLYANLIGHSITLADAQAAAEKITARYRQDGYILSQAILPKQDITDSLTIQVVEGYIAKVTIKGDAKDQTALMRRYADRIMAEKPATMHTIERYMLLMNDLPGVTAQSTLMPSPDAFGAAEMIITISRKTVDGNLSIDNRGTKYIGPMQYSASAAFNSLFGLDERTVVRAVTTSPTRELRFIDATHEEQLDDDGTRLLLSGSFAHTAPRYTLTPLDIDGDMLFLQAKLEHPFIRSREENLLAHVAFDYRNTDTDSAHADLSNDRLRTLRLGGDYSFIDRFEGSNQLGLEASQGINILHASGNDPHRSNTGQSDFTKFNLDVSHTQPLNDMFSLFTAVSGQYALDTLLPAEQFALGGPSYGSAYDPAELSGDHGAAFRAELRYSEAPTLRYLNAFQLYCFYDLGAIWDRGVPNSKSSLASAGTGIRANLTSYASGSAELAVPLTREVSTEHDNAPRLFMGLTGRF